MTSRCFALCLAAVASAVASLPCAAADWNPGQLFVQVATSRDHTDSLTLGARWPWAWRGQLGSMEATAATEVFASHWRAESLGGGRSSYTQLGVVPVLRLRFAQGRSPWFVEGGIGLTWTDRLYDTPDRQFSTTGNFIDTLAVGRSFGADAAQELSLRFAHFSNGGASKPNPGLNFLQLRYAAKF